MIKILIVDDSPSSAARIKYLIDPEEDMLVIAVAKNSKEAVALTARLKPNLIIMDIKIP